MHLTKRRFDVVNQKQVILLVIPPIFLALATVTVAIRWHARKTKRINTLSEDLLCLCGLVMSLLVVIIVFVLVLVDGQGLPTTEVAAHFGQHLKIRWWLRTQFAVDICWATSVAAVQLSLLQFYTRLYSDSRAHYRTVCRGMMFIVAAWYVYSIIAWAHACHPPGTCALPNKTNCIVIGSLHVAFNALVMLLAIPAVFDMNLSNKKKMSTLGLFLLGSFCTICAILRMDCVFPFFADIKTDPIGAAWGRMLFSPLEIAVGIIACSIPTLALFHHGWRDQRRHLPKEGTGLRRLKFRTSSSGSSTSNLNPAHWVGKSAGQVNAFVSLEDGGKSTERVRDLGTHDIKVTKEYNVVRPL